MNKIDLDSMPCIERHKKIWEIYNKGKEYFDFLIDRDEILSSSEDMARCKLFDAMEVEAGRFIKDVLAGEVDVNEFGIQIKDTSTERVKSAMVEMTDPNSGTELYTIRTSWVAGASPEEVSAFVKECEKSVANHNKNKNVAFSEAEAGYIKEWEGFDKEYKELKEDALYRDSSENRAKFQDLLYRRSVSAARFIADILTGKIDKDKFYIKLDEGSALLSKTYSRIIVSTPDKKKSLAGLFEFRLNFLKHSLDKKDITLKGFLCNCVDEVCNHGRTLYKGPVKAEMVDEYLVDEPLLDVDPPKVELRPIKQPIGGEMAVFPPHIIRIDDVRTEAENELKKANVPDKNGLDKEHDER